MLTDLEDELAYYKSLRDSIIASSDNKGEHLDFINSIIEFKKSQIKKAKEES